MSTTSDTDSTRYAASVAPRPTFTDTSPSSEVQGPEGVLVGDVVAAVEDRVAAHLTPEGGDRRALVGVRHRQLHDRLAAQRPHVAPTLAEGRRLAERGLGVGLGQAARVHGDGRPLALQPGPGVTVDELGDLRGQRVEEGPLVVVEPVLRGDVGAGGLGAVAADEGDRLRRPDAGQGAQGAHVAARRHGDVGVGERGQTAQGRHRAGRGSRVVGVDGELREGTVEVGRHQQGPRLRGLLQRRAQPLGVLLEVLVHRRARSSVMSRSPPCAAGGCGPPSRAGAGRRRARRGSGPPTGRRRGRPRGGAAPS